MEILFILFFLCFIFCLPHIVCYILYGVGLSEWWNGETGVLGKKKLKDELPCEHEYIYYSKNYDECKKCGATKWNNERWRMENKK